VARHIIGHEDLGQAAEVFEGAHRRADEVGKPLRPRRLDKRVVARPEHGDEEFDLGHLAGQLIDDPRPLSGVVDEALLASAVDLPHDDAELLLPRRVQLTETAVFVRPERGLAGGAVAVFDPECLQRHARSRELAMHPREVDRHARRRLVATHVAK